MSEQNRYDSIIIGAGAAGLTAALYAARRAMNVLVISQDVGGQAATTNEIENYPGVGLISGPELMTEFKNQATKFGANFAFEQVIKVDKLSDTDNTPLFKIKTTTQEYFSNTVILAYGLTHRHLGVLGEEELGGRGVTYCATCDGPLYKNKKVVVVGGGNSAVDAALLLAKIASQVYLIHRNNNFSAEAVLVEQLKQPNIEVILSSQLKQIKGAERVASVIVNEVADINKEREIEVDGVFIEVGYVVNSKLIDGLVELDARKQIKISPDAETSQPGVFAAGDITTISFKQIVISSGWGATAALKAYEYLQKVKGFRGVNIDWGIKKN